MESSYNRCNSAQLISLGDSSVMPFWDEIVVSTETAHWYDTQLALHGADQDE